MNCINRRIPSISPSLLSLKGQNEGEGRKRISDQEFMKSLGGELRQRHGPNIDEGLNSGKSNSVNFSLASLYFSKARALQRTAFLLCQKSVGSCLPRF